MWLPLDGAVRPGNFLVLGHGNLIHSAAIRIKLNLAGQNKEKKNCRR